MQWPPVQSHIVSCVVCRRKYAPLPASQTPLHPACGSDFSFDTAITTSARATMEDYCFYTFGQKVNEGSLKVRQQWKNQWTMKCLFFASVQAESVQTYFIVEFMCRLFVILVSLGFCLPRCLLSSLFQVTDHTPFFGYPGKMSCFFIYLPWDAAQCEVVADNGVNGDVFTDTDVAFITGVLKSFFLCGHSTTVWSTLQFSAKSRCGVSWAVVE